MKQTIKLSIAFLLMAALFAACKPEIELSGSAWSNSVSGTDSDGDHYTATYTMVCNTASSGMLFLTVSYADDEMPFCFAMPLTYTWDGNKGTATATLSIPEEGTQTFSIPVTWSKTTPLSASFNQIAQVFGIGWPLELEQKSFAKPASMDGTTWTMSISGEYDECNYELEFVNATGAVLNLALVEGDYTENMRWNINYTYSGGIGTTSLYADGENIKGGFYMPDENTMLFSDGENGLLLTKQQ